MLINQSLKLGTCIVIGIFSGALYSRFFQLWKMLSANNGLDKGILYKTISGRRIAPILQGLRSPHSNTKEEYWGRASFNTQRYRFRIKRVGFSVIRTS